jgi:tetratricopeptide (TPR) repeat protein
MLKKPLQKKDVSQAGHSFNVFVPRNYKPGLPHGLLVQIDVQQSGSFPAGWDSILEKHHIIWMAPNGAGQGSSATKRVTLAVNGAVNVQKKYTIDPERVYVLGYYDGSLPATAAATGFPSIFRGLVMTYPAFYRRISYKDGNIKYMLGESLVFNSSQRGIAVARKSTRVVMMGRESKMFKMVYDKGFKPDGFRYVLYDTGSTMTGFQGGLPGAKGLEKSIGFLDGPVSPTAERYYRKGKTYDRTKNTGMAFNAYATALMRGGKQKFTADAKKRVDELYPKIVKELYAAEDSVLQTIEDRKFIQAAVQIRKLKSHGPIATPVMTKLEEQLATAKKGGAITRRPSLPPLAKGDGPGKDPLEQVDPRIMQREEAEKAREEARKRRAAVAMKQFEDAKALLEKDLLEGYIALRNVAKKNREFEAGTKATQLAEDTINDPKKRRILKPALEERDAAELLKIARNYVSLNKLDEAYDELRKLIKEYPRTRSATEARALMEQIRQRRDK